jgi:hypothetical protein
VTLIFRKQEQILAPKKQNWMTLGLKRSNRSGLLKCYFFTETRKPLDLFIFLSLGGFQENLEPPGKENAKEENPMLSQKTGNSGSQGTIGSSKSGRSLGRKTGQLKGFLKDVFANSLK